MSTLEVGVELLVTGALMLAALLLPAYGIWHDALPTEEGVLALVGTIAAGVAFGLGVVVDRCADSLLSSWEGALRVTHAWRHTLKESRRVLVEEAKRPLTDCFPEDWMRAKALAAEEGVVRWLDQLRVRIRIARTIGILAPALVTSGLMALSKAAPWWGGVLQLAALGLIFQADVLESVKPPRTWKELDRPGRRKVARWFLASPATAWLVLQAITAIALVAALPQLRCVAGCVIVFGGALMTLLALQVWARVQSTFYSWLWSTLLTADREGLRAACTTPREPKSKES